MAETTLESALDVAIDPDFEPQKRPRSCTWPLPESSSAKPACNDTDIIPEEEDDEDDCAMAINANGVGEGEDSCSPSLATNGQENTGSPLSSQLASATTESPGASGQGSQPQTPRKTSSRRNAWGNLSYADLITKAIESTPDKRLTLSQIYDWMVRSVPYFKDKGDSNSSAGWKVSAPLENVRARVCHARVYLFNLCHATTSQQKHMSWHARLCLGMCAHEKRSATGLSSRARASVVYEVGDVTSKQTISPDASIIPLYIKRLSD